MTEHDKPAILEYYSELKHRVSTDDKDIIKSHIAAGRLPDDLYFRMNVIGY